MTEPMIENVDKYTVFKEDQVFIEQVQLVIHVTYNKRTIQIVEYDDGDIRAYHPNGMYICKLEGGMLSAQIASLSLLGFKM